MQSRRNALKAQGKLKQDPGNAAKNEQPGRDQSCNDVREAKRFVFAARSQNFAVNGDKSARKGAFTHEPAEKHWQSESVNESVPLPGSAVTLSADNVAA